MSSLTHRTPLLALLIVSIWTAALSGCPSTPQVAVPDLTGLSVAHARAVLGMAGLQLGEWHREPSAAVAPDLIFTQDPAAGTLAALGSIITVTVAEAPVNTEGETAAEGESGTEGQTLEGETDGTEGEVVTEGETPAEGEVSTEGQSEGDASEGEAQVEGEVTQDEGEVVSEGETLVEGQAEGSVEGESSAEGQPQSEGEDLNEGEGLQEGETPGEGQAEGNAEGENVLSQKLVQYTHEGELLGYDYSIESETTVAAANAKVYAVNMTSGYWRSSDEVVGGHELWTHKMLIVRPSSVNTNTALLIVAGGSIGNGVGASDEMLAVSLAASSNSVVAVVKTIPNEPLQFTDETHTRTEDEIIAYSYDRFMLTVAAGEPDYTWPLLFPMARAAVRAMDTVQTLMSDQEQVAVQDFVVTGASKRGWTTWLTGAADTRVKGIMPLVIDVLHMPQQIQHHFNSYGAYSTALWDYVDMNVFQRLDTYEGSQLLALVDPYSYLNVLTMPKMILNSTGDQFFLPDAMRFYFDDLQGEKHIYSAPNTDHSMTNNVGALDSGVIQSLYTFFYTIANDIERPSITWSYEAPNRIVVNTSTTPARVLLWTATNPTARDFRLNPENIAQPSDPAYIAPGTVGPAWTSQELTSATNEYTATVPEPGSGWTAYFVQVAFSGYGNLQIYSPTKNTMEKNGSAEFVCDTQTRVFPDTYPQKK